MAKLSETFTLGGGKSTAPISNNQSIKLSDSFTLSKPTQIPTFAAPTPAPETASFTTQNVNIAAPNIAGLSHKEKIATLKPQINQAPTPTYDEIIQEYESLPNTNFFSRLWDPKSAAAYKRKQELNPIYEQAKDIQTKEKLDALGLTDYDIVEGMSGSSPYFALRELFKSKGMTDNAEIKELIKASQDMVKRTTSANTKKNMENWADEHPVLGTLASFPLKVGSDIAGLAQNTVNYLAGNPLTNSTGGNWGTQLVQGMRNEVSDEMGGVGRLAYNVGTSIGDMAPIIALGGAPGLAYAGGAAAQGSIPELIDRGLTPNQIILTSLANGAAEAALEKLPLGNLEKWAQQPIEKSFKSIAKVIGSQMANEGIEETGTDIANTIFDALINGDQAELNQSIKEKGFWPAMGDYLKQVGYDGLAGALSGGIMGGGAAGVNVARNGFYDPNNELPTLDQQAETEQAEIPKVNEEITTPDVNEPKLSETFTVNNQDNRIEAKTDEQLSEEKERIYEQLEKMNRGELRPDEYIQIGETPGYLASLGNVDNPLVMKQSGARKAIYPEGYMNYGGKHNLGFDGVANIPDYLNNPVAVTESKTQDNSAVLLTDMFDGNGYPVILPIQMDKQSDMGIINEVPTGYGIQNPERFLDSSNVLFKNEKRINDVLAGNGLQLPDLQAQYDPMNRINQNNKSVNTIENAQQETNTELSQHYASENQKINNFLNKKSSGSIEMENGQIIEHYSIKDMKAVVNEFKANGVMPEDNQVAIRYNDGTVKVYGEGDDLSDLDLRNVSGIIWGNENTNAYAGKGIKAQNYGEINGGDWGDDWRLDFTTRQDAAQTLEAPEPQEIQTLEAPEKPASKEIQTLEKPKEKVMNEDYGIPNRNRRSVSDDGEEITLEINLDNGVPTITDENGTTSQVATNSLYKFFQYDKEGTDHLIQNIEDGLYQKQTKSMQKTYENAIDQIAKYGAIAKYDDVMKNGIQTDDDLALAHNLLTYFYKKGDMVRVDMLMSKIQQSGTNIGRALHFFNIFGDSPLGVQQTTAKLAGSKAKQFINEADKNPRGKKAKQVEKIKEVAKDITENTREVKERKKKSAKLAKALKYNVEQKMKQQLRKESGPKTFDMILEEVNNTLEDEYASVKFSDDARLFFATMIQDDVKVEIMADEIDHYMKHGSFYPLEQEKSVPKPTSKKLDSILARMGNDTVIEKDAVQTFDQIREEVKNSLEREMASIDFTDDEISYLARMIEYGATNEEITNAIVQKLATGYMTMTAEDIEKITQLYDQADHAATSKESAELKKQAAAIGAKYLGDASFMDKWNAWRYLAMLGNPRTMIRNILGNTMFGAVTDVKDAVGALIESKYVKEGERTKAILNPKTDKALIDACEKDFDRVAYEEATKGGSKFDMRSEIEGQRRIFKGNKLEGARNLTSNILENSDIKALRIKYKKALAGYLKANGHNASILNTENEVATKAREYAIKQAKEATFHSDNALAEVLSRASRSLRERGDAIGKVGEVAIESLAPFKKTPANILQQGIEFSPLGILKFFNQVRTKADLTARIDTLSKTFTGTTILAIGAFLASKGLLIGKRDEEDDPFRKGSDYALKIGNHTYTIDWAAPAALPLFVGAELFKAFNPNESADEAKNFFETFVSLADPVLEMSMLQGLNNMLNTLASSKNNSLGSTLTNIGAGYASQVIPTLAGQVARTIDPYRRSTRTNTSSYTNPALAIAEKTLIKGGNKIPILSMANEKYLDAWGEPQKNNGGNILGRAFQNFISPGYLNDTSLSQREQKLAQLEKTYTGNGSLIPSLADNNKPSGGRLTNKEYTKWAQTRGNELKSAVDAALNYAGKVKEKDLQDYIHDIENFANSIAKNKQFGTPIPKTYKKAHEAYIKGGRSYKAVMDYYIGKSKSK